MTTTSIKTAPILEDIQWMASGLHSHDAGPHPWFPCRDAITMQVTGRLHQLYLLNFYHPCKLKNHEPRHLFQVSHILGLLKSNSHWELHHTFSHTSHPPQKKKKKKQLEGVLTTLGRCGCWKCRNFNSWNSNKSGW